MRPSLGKEQSDGEPSGFVVPPAEEPMVVEMP